MRRAAALWLCAVEASARYYALSPEDGAVLVSDKVYVAITLVDKIPEGSRRTWTDIGDAPSSQNALCVRAASQFVCWAGQSASSGYEWQFLDYTQAPGGGPTELLIEAYLKAADLSVTSETSSLVTAWKPAMLAGYAPSKAPSRRVFDVFPLFGGHEMDLFQIRTKELSGAVDVFVSVEADVAHSGLAKDVEFAHHRDRHPRFAEVNVTAHVARLTGSDSGNREEAQRDAALEALVQAGARPGDLVILNDADEVTSRAALDTALQCAAVLDAEGVSLDALLPLALEQDWYTYDVRWKSKRPWGTFAREGAVMVTAGMLGVSGGATNSKYKSRRASEWRRQFRDPARIRHGETVPRLIKSAGWHFSSFGGAKAVATKLVTGIGVEQYGGALLQDESRLERLIENGVAFFELATKKRSFDEGAGRIEFECSESVDTLPQYMQENSAKLAYLFGHHRGCSRRRSGEDRHALDVDITRARSDAPDGRLSNFFYEGGFQTNSYSSTADCAIDAGIVDEAKLRLTTKPKCESHGLSQEGCDAVLRISKDMCREHFAAGHVELDGSTTRSFSIPLLFIFQDREDFVLTVDGAEIILSIDAETDVSTYSAEICSKYHLKPDDQRVLLQALRGIQPPKYYK